jgi:hypothetical protein
MKTKLLSLLLAGSMACATTVPPVRSFPNEVEEALTQVNLDQYSPTPSAPDAPVDIRAIAGGEEARRAGAQGERMSEATREHPVGSHDQAQHIMYGHWNGLCMNEPALNHIAASVNQVVRTTRADDFARLETLGANAMRDIRTLQTDTQTIRSLYQSRVNERDIALREADNSIKILQRSQRNSLLLSVGLGVSGILVGVGVSALFVLFTQ